MSETNAERLERMQDVTIWDGLYEDDLSWLVEQASKAQELEKENQLLYGRLNMISDIIEEGRKAND